MCQDDDWWVGFIFTDETIMVKEKVDIIYVWKKKFFFQSKYISQKQGAPDS